MKKYLSKIASFLKSKTFLITFFLLIFVLVASFIFLQSSYFNVKEIAVKPSHADNFQNVDDLEIKSDLEIKFKNKQFFVIKPEEIRKDTIKLSPFVKKVEVHKVFPDKINVEIEERIPFLLVQSNKGCTLLDKDRYVLDMSVVKKKEDAETAQVLDCGPLQSKYKVPVFLHSNLKTDFQVGKESTFYDVENIYKISKALTGQSFQIEKVEFFNDVYFIKVGPDKTIVISSNQELKIQLKRFILVSQSIKDNGIEFKTLDLRYERPVLTK